MRIYALLSVIFFAVSAFAQQPVTPFLSRLTAKLATIPLPSQITLTGSVDWTAGSTKVSGPASLVANSDGSTTISYSLGSFSRSESTSPWATLATDRNCAWTDQSGAAKAVSALNCLLPVPWFAPSIVGPGRLTSIMQIIDDGLVTFESMNVNRLTISPNFLTSTPRTQGITNAAAVKVYYDSATLNAIALEYAIHADDNDALAIPVTVIFSDFRPVGLLSLPFHVDRFVNGVQQVSIQADSVVTK